MKSVCNACCKAGLVTPELLGLGSTHGCLMQYINFAAILHLSVFARQDHGRTHSWLHSLDCRVETPFTGWAK